MIKFEVLGKPIGKGRPRFANRGKFVQTYTPEKTINYESLVRYTFQSMFPNHKIYDKPLKVKIDAFFEIPKSYTKKRIFEIELNDNLYTNKPDADNIAKIVLDSLNGIAYRDDSQVALLEVNKHYDVQSKVVVEMKEIDEIIKEESETR